MTLTYKKSCIDNQDLNIQNYFIREPFDPTLLR